MSKTSYEQFNEDMAGCLEIGCTLRVLLLGFLFGTVLNTLLNYWVDGSWCLYHRWCL